MHTREEKLEAFGRILDILDELREKCPWDRKQTNDSLRPQTIEETYELSDAILKADSHEISRAPCYSGHTPHAMQQFRLPGSHRLRHTFPDASTTTTQTR